MPFTHRQSVAGVVHFFVGVAELLLLLRVVLRFFNGNPDATFIHWCYASTATLLEPLRGVFPSYNVVNHGWVVDFVALFAMAAYAVAGYLAVSLLGRWAKK
ncbi:MAG TPA: YggT family protein [Candidatus Saccharimonadales bacterium]|nr:YggT family protein [Candidatus Saccharimonadales bacterium]